MKYIVYLISLIILALAGLFFFISIDNQAKKDAIGRLHFQERILCKQAASGLEEYFKYYKQLMTFLSEHDDIIKNTPDGQELIRSLYNAQSETILTITRVDSNKKIVYTYPDTKAIGKDVSSQSHIKKIFVTQAPVLSNVFKSVQGFETVALHVPVFENGKFSGSLAILFSFNELSKKYIGNIAIGESGYAVLINQDGIQLYSPVTGNIGKSLYEVMLNNKPVGEMIDRMRAGEEGDFLYYYGTVEGSGIRKHASFAPIRIENTLWSICVTAPEDEALQHIGELRNRLLILILIVFSGIIVSIIMLVRRLIATRRDEMSKASDAIINKVQKESEKSLALLGAAITESPSGIVVVDAADMTILTCNRAATEAFAYHQESVIGIDYDTFTAGVTIINPKTLSVVPNDERSIVKAIKNGDVFVNQEFIIWDKENKLKWVSANISPVRDKDTKIIAGIVLVSDITDKKKIEESIRESEARFRTLFNSAKDSISIIKDSVYYDCNTATEAIFACPHVEFIGKNPSQFSPKLQPNGETSESLMYQYFNSVMNGEPQFFDWTHTRSDGKEFFSEVSLSRMEYSGEYMMIAIVRDVSERKLAEARSKELEEQLLQSQKIESLGRLAGGIAHDINNMLTPIIGYSEVLLNELPEGDKRRSRLQNIIKSVLSSRDMVRQLLAFARKQSLEFQSINLNDVVDGFGKIIRRTIRENISINYHLDPLLNQVMADKSQFEQILMNLCINAQDAMPEGGHLFIRTENVAIDSGMELHGGAIITPGEYVMVSVSDTGVGIDKEIQDKIFEPFFTTKGVGRGTGLGLATVHGIVKQHGGYIRIYSDMNKGTTFKLYIPRIESAQNAIPNLDAGKEIKTGKETLLVIEDDEQVRTMTVDLLASLGYRVLSAANGVTTLQAIREHGDQIDLILSDVLLPDANGKELYDEVSKITPGKKVIFMSGYTSDVISHFNYLDSGVNFIQKPFSIKALAAKIRELLDE